MKSIKTLLLILSMVASFACSTSYRTLKRGDQIVYEDNQGFKTHFRPGYFYSFYKNKNMVLISSDTILNDETRITKVKTKNVYE